MSSIGVGFPASIVAGIEHPIRGRSYPYSWSCLIRPDSSHAVVGRGLTPLASKSTTNGEMEKTSHHKLRSGGLAEDGFSYKERFVVRSHEVGFNRTVTIIQTFANFFQVIVINNLFTLKRNDVVEVETWCQCEGNINTRRDWIISDYATGQVIGRATRCKWLLMNKETRRLQKAPDGVPDEIRKYSPKQPRLAFPEANGSNIKKIEKLAEPAQYSRLGLTPRRVDLDMNNHVNNVTYIGWLLESVPNDIHLSHELQSLTLEYRRECRHNDMIDSLMTHEGEGAVKNQSSNIEHEGTTNELECIPWSKDGGDGNGVVQFRHLLRLSGNGAETNRGITKWREKKPLK